MDLNVLNCITNEDYDILFMSLLVLNQTGVKRF